MAMDKEELAAILAEEERQAIAFIDAELVDNQETAIAYYNADPFGDEEEGRSQVVTPDVAEVIDYMTISILRTCVSGDRVVEFEAREPDQEESACEATEAVSWAFMRQQDGYKVLTDWLQSGLKEKIGVVKTACVEKEKKVKRRAVVNEDELSMLMETEQPAAVTDNGDGSYLVEVQTVEKKTRYVDYPIPSEEFLFSARCKTEDDMGYKAHRTLKTISELIEMGFDRDTVESLPAGEKATDVDSRSALRWNNVDAVETNVPGMRKVWLREEYLHIDVDDDGIAELVQVFRVGNVVLKVEEVDENPFAVFCPFPQAHKLVGNSLADKCMDIQRIRSVILRQTLDGVYMTNNPRMWVPNECADENTIEDLLTVRPGGLVRGKGSGGRPEPMYEPFDIQRGLGMLEFFAGERESRTGITRLNQGLDADTLNKTATGASLMQAQGQQMEEYIARNFAEAMARLFLKKLRLMIAKGDPIAVKVGGMYRQADPSEWSDDMDVSIRVGLGSGRKEQRLLYRTQLLQFQREGMMAGLVKPEHIYANIAGIIRDAALGEPENYWMDPDSEEAQMAAQQPQGPSPEEQKLMADQQAQQAKLQLEHQKAASELELRQAESAAKIQAMREEAAAKLELEREKAQTEYRLAMEKMQTEAALAERKMLIEAEIARETEQVKAAHMGDGLSSYRPGGALDE